MVVDMKRMEILRCLPTELLLDMIDNLDELSDDSKQIALEEIVYVLYEREMKANE